MNKILVTAGGTAIAWHIAEIIRRFFNNQVELHVSDINDAHLIPASVIAKKVHKVPLTMDPQYVEAITKIITDEKIDIIIPLIPYEGILFAKDSEFIKELNIKTTTATMEVTKLLSDKFNLYNTLNNIGVPTPELYDINNVQDDVAYLLKPRLGFGSVGITKVMGYDLKKNKMNFDLANNVISQYCHDTDYDEVTVEVYNGKSGLHIFTRRRIATKAEVCVKMEPVNNEIFFPYVKKIVKTIQCPLAFNVQFLFHNSEWKLFDCNLRLGAGTALSTTVGFQLTRALIAELLDEKVEEELFKVDTTIISVLRVYQEIAIR